MDALKFVNDYIQWLKNNTTSKLVRNDIVVISSPFWDRNNDNIQLYIKKTDNDDYVITDDGYTISDLEMSGFSFNTPKRQRELSILLNSYGLSLNDDEIYCDCNLENFPFKKHSFIQGILAINDLFVLSQPNVLSFFLEDVEQYFIQNDIRFTKNIKLTGKSGFDHTYDFVIPRSKAASERLIKVSNNLDKTITQNIIFAWNDTMQMRDTNTRLYTFANNSEKKISNTNINALRQYGIVPIEWTKRERFLSELAS